MPRRRFQPNIKRNSTFTLNITSMTDMFTIMLVFLLQTYSTSQSQLQPQADLRLPSSSSEKNPVHASVVILTAKTLRFGDKDIAVLKDLRFEEKDLDPKDDSFIPGLFQELDQRAKASDARPEDKEGRLLLQADRDVPYSTLKKVLYTASMAGYPQLKMVTTMGN